jgi:hypothetical protein
MGRMIQTTRKPTGGKAPRKQLASAASRRRQVEVEKDVEEEITVAAPRATRRRRGVIDPDELTEDVRLRMEEAIKVTMRRRMSRYSVLI